MRPAARLERRPGTARRCVVMALSVVTGSLGLQGARAAEAGPRMAAAAAVSASPNLTPELPVGDWDFRVTLDGKPVGEHRFTVSGQGRERTVRSVASFDVKLLGLTVYRYRHQADERWRDGCLVSLKAATNDDGKMAEVTAGAGTAGDPALQVTRPGGSDSLSGCVMSFAYWNPAMQAQSRLLNPQTGRNEAVQIGPGRNGTVDLRGKAVEARQVVIAGPKEAIELWYSPQGEWLGLDSSVNGHLLSYRLK